MRVKLGELMIAEKLITHDDLDAALEYQSRRGGVLGRVMLRLGFVKKGDLCSVLSRQLGIPSVDLWIEDIDPLAVLNVPAECARRYHFMPFRLSKKVLSIAIADPTDLTILDEIGLTTGFQLIPFVAPRDDIASALHLYYRDWLSLLQAMMELPDGIFIERVNTSPFSATEPFTVGPEADYELPLGFTENIHDFAAEVQARVNAELEDAEWIATEWGDEIELDEIFTQERGHITVSKSPPSFGPEWEELLQSVPLGPTSSLDASGWDDPGVFESVSEESQPPIQFSVFHPRIVMEDHWYQLLVYVHLPQCLGDIRADSDVRLGSASKEYRLVDTSATPSIARGAEIVAVPEIQGCRFETPRASIMWLEDWHGVEFKFQASQEVPGFVFDAPMSGRVRFYVGPIQVAEVDIWVIVSPEAVDPGEKLPVRIATGEICTSVFVSYSHEDSAVSDLLNNAYRVLGMPYLRDVRALRSGWKWNRALRKKIEEADFFQLLWSTRAKNSEHVEREWRYALTLNRPSFIRPTYWQEPMPVPPRGLSSLDFSYLDLFPEPEG